ncbi:MAG TPA: cation-translocating P-type ATPase [Candidatus Ligilactobacillus excrementigallinarum]|uniref:P-type Ca(2+) transporter n=1 Tax=Candidatus Ligilactobacillus excrementigallinarum TaxID=2838641 RepID=A0A9D1UVQ8_9LACO|nr:cation-translocating P-type ATPase [Candidatus Ligilactobacillus excrementigallinarum]
MKTRFYQMTDQAVLKQLDSSADGLTSSQVQERQQKFAKNVLAAKKHTTLLQKFVAQFKDMMIIILIAAALVAMLAGEVSDALIIFLVVLLNAIFGVFQEAKAENAIDALQEMTTPTTRVRRNGVVTQIKSEELVPGDIVLLEAGDIVPADVRLLSANNLKIEEAALTGESVPVEKNTAVMTKEQPPLGEQHNLGFMNTNVTYGTAEAVVIRTGMQTEVGHIASMLNDVEKAMTPLQKNITHLSKVLSILILLIAIVIFIFGTVTGRESVLDMLLTAISLAVAAIPEGLPAIVTITLALGTQSMAKRQALVRKLPAVETLGSTEIIASDKTGTLTQNKMTVEQFYENGKLTNADNYQTTINDHLPQIMILANDSQKTPDGLVGDPTETALIQYYLDHNFPVNKIENEFIRVGSIPFESERKLMSVIVRDQNQQLSVMTKGAVDELLRRTTQILDNGKVRKINENDRKQILKINHDLAQDALRVLGYAYRPLTNPDAEFTSENYEHDLIFVGLTGMIDPQRPEVKNAVKEAKEAGIRPLMITGDHKDTARAIAIRLGIISPDNYNGVITGHELDQMSDKELRKKITQYSVFARVAPEHKVRIVKAWQSHGKVVAMTGDGVNDAPALKTADIGVGMGITGTEVSKNASDIVLADDNFATIIVAVKEGRKVFANIQKAIQYLLSANLGEVLTLSMMTFLNWTIFAPVQILWINLVTDTFPAIALGIEKSEKGIMKQKPRGNRSNFLSNGVGASIIYQGLLEGLITLGVYWYALHFPFHHNSAAIHADALTMAYATLGLLQLFHAFNCKSLHGSIFNKQIFNNKFFNLSILASALLLGATIFIPGFNKTFHVTQLAFQQWLIVILAGVLLISIVEIVKFVIRKKNQA